MNFNSIILSAITYLHVSLILKNLFQNTYQRIKVPIKLLYIYIYTHILKGSGKHFFNSIKFFKMLTHFNLNVS